MDGDALQAIARQRAAELPAAEVVPRPFGPEYDVVTKVIGKSVPAVHRGARGADRGAEGGPSGFLRRCGRPTGTSHRAIT